MSKEPVTIENMKRTMTAARVRELQEMRRVKQSTYGAARTRVQNWLVENGYARFLNDGDLCGITARGLLILAAWEKEAAATDDPAARLRVAHRLGREKETV